MSVVYKYPIELGDTLTVRDGYFSHFGTDPNGDRCVWLQHSDTNHGTMRLYIVGTGMAFPDDDIVLGSLVEGNFVWHLVMAVVL